MAPYLRTCVLLLMLALGLTLMAPPAITSADAAEAAEGAPGAPFTIAVIPDTQKYTLDDSLARTMTTQTDWITANRERLGIKLTVHLGDLVESWPNQDMWRRVSDAMTVLDRARMPYTVVPGNHDLDYDTGQATTYRQHFPVSRFRDADWSGTGVRFGGHLGSQPTDPTDRGMMNSYHLMEAGGLSWLVLNLEYETPDYSLQWAQRVIDAHPGRRVILTTHSFIDVRGWRTNEIRRRDAGTRTAQQLWNQLVYRNCQIDLVLSGHYYAGDLGEARRTDANACGEPVHQVLSDYQERANGGNGWLRYYTFDPANDSIAAHTYSPTLDATETDADSRFDLAYDMEPGSAPTRDVVLRGGETWGYRASRDPWPTGWDSRTYDDSAWPRGQAPLGYGPAGYGGRMAQTTVDPTGSAADRPVTFLYRKRFDLPQLTDVSALRLLTKADDGLVVRVNGVEVGRSGVGAGGVSGTSYASAAPRSQDATPLEFAVPPSLLRETDNVVAVSTHLNATSSTDSHFDLVAVAELRGTEPPPPVSEPVTLVADDASWRWQFSTSAWPANWTSAAFADASWPAGPAPLGFGSAVATNIDVAPPSTNRGRSALFRRSFQVDDPAELSDLRLLVRADDGVMVTVNGQEVARVRAPAGTLSSSSYATSAPSTTTAAASPTVVDIPSSALRAGTNVIAAATLLNYRATPNISFTARLTGTRTTVAAPPTTPVPATPDLRASAASSRTVRLTWAPGDSTTVSSWALSRDGVKIADISGGTTSYDDSGRSPGTTYAYELTAVNSTGSSPPARAEILTPASQPVPATLIAAGSAWHHRFSATWPDGWTQAGFDDASWAEGPAVLGFGSGAISTTVDVPAPTSNRPRSMLLRRSFAIDDPSSLSSLTLTTRADDGVVVYVNGTEIGRANVGAGAVTPATYATAAPRTASAAGAPRTWSVPTSALRPGTNAVSAVVLLNYRATPDVSFDAVLNGLRQD